MPAKPSGQVKTSIIHKPQKNGDIYVLERKTLYDPVKKYNRVLSTKLLSKIPKGSEIPVPTRPKRKKNGDPNQKSEILTAKRDHVGMMDIIDHIGTASGIDDAIYASTDIGTAQKILSLARYLFATNGQSLPGILTWQYNHPLPYEDGITEDVYHNLFVRIGTDESLQQNFFKHRCALLSAKDALAYDSSTISTYSNSQNEARYGFNKAHDGLKTIKLLTLYSIENRQPIVFTKQPGNLPDVTSVTNAIRQLTALGVKTTEIITDNGYYSEQNFSELLQAGFDFITLAKTNIQWIKPEVDKQREALDGFGSLCPYDQSIHGVCVLLKHDFEKTRKYANQKSGAAAGSTETFTRRIYLHIYFNLARHNAAKAAFDTDMFELKTLLENGTSMDDLSATAREKVKKYFTVKKWGNKITAVPNNKAMKEANQYHGYFVLVSNKERDPFECLRKYRKRETIESFFEAEKQHADGTRPRVWSGDTLRGRMFVQFVALCYYEYFSEQIRKLKGSLGVETGDKDHDTQKNLQEEQKLKSWLCNTPLYLQLQWFDAVERVELSVKLTHKRWSTEITERDALYLEKLGVSIR
jgi:transposase